MALLFSLIISLSFASVAVILIDQYFARQSVRHWLNLSHSLTGWGRLAEVLEEHFVYRRSDVETSFAQAGIDNKRLAVIYFPMKIILMALCVGAVFLWPHELGLYEFNQQLVAALIAVVMVIIVPDTCLQSLKRKRIRKVSTQLPYVIDLMAVCIKTGMTIEASVGYLAQELRSYDRDLAFVMTRVDSVAKVSGMQVALDEMAEQFPTSQVRSFVHTLSQSIHYGSSVFDVLTSLSSNLREVEMLELEERVGKLSAKMSVPLILFIMFPVVILITAPGIMRMLSHG